MPVRNCCTGCQQPFCGPFGGPCSSRCDCGMGPTCVFARGNHCYSPCGDLGCIHGAHAGVAGSYFSCGHACIGGCTGGVCNTCCGPCCQ